MNRQNDRLIRSLGNRQGFTLVEILVVIAVTALLSLLLVAPLVQSFNITRRTQVAVRAQDSARLALEQVSREVQKAVFVYDNTGQSLDIPVGPATFRVPYARVDLVLPRVVMHCYSENHPAGVPRDYNRGLLAWPLCPVGHAGSDEVEARPINPIEPDSLMVRYFVGLRDPMLPYRNVHEDRFALASDVPNTFVLYRAEFSPYDPNLIDTEGGTVNGLLRPDFFYNMNTAPNGMTYAQNWKRVSQIIGPSQNMDLVIVQRDAGGNPTSASSSVQFIPNTVTNDVLTPTEIGRQSDGEPDSPPTVYRASRGQWSPDYQIRVFRDNFSVVYYTQRDPDSGHTVIRNAASGDIVFDITAWETARQIVPPSPEFMFTVDPNKGEVSFAFPSWLMAPSEEDVFVPSLINQAYFERLETEGASARMIVLQKFDAIRASMPYARIVPGSERVIGPNWNVGPDYGSPVQYTKVPYLTEDPGPNQYRIDYRTGRVYFYSLPHPNMPEGVGGQPVAPVEVFYSVQNNQGFDPEQGDILTVDYITKNIMSVQIGYRIYDDRDRPQALPLSSNVLVRNFQR